MRNGCRCIFMCRCVYVDVRSRVYTSPCSSQARGVYEHNSLKYSSAWQEVALAPVINELKFGVATLSRFFSLVSRIVASSSSVVRLPAPISQVPRYGELSFWPPRKPSVTPFALLPLRHVLENYIAVPWLSFGSCSRLLLFLPSDC